MNGPAVTNEYFLSLSEDSLINKITCACQNKERPGSSPFLKRTNGTKLLAIYRNDSIRRKPDSSRRHSVDAFVFLVECELFLAVSSKRVKSTVLIPFGNLAGGKGYIEKGLSVSSKFIRPLRMVTGQDWGSQPPYCLVIQPPTLHGEFRAGFPPQQNRSKPGKLPSSLSRIPSWVRILCSLRQLF